MAESQSIPSSLEIARRCIEENGADYLVPPSFEVHQRLVEERDLLAAALLLRQPESPDVDPFALITDEWLCACHFGWRQEERQPTKHWTLWLGMPGFMGSPEDVGIELARVTTRDASWFCWLRSDSSHRYARFIHVRHIETQGDVMALVAAVTGQRWNVANHRYGRVCTPEQITQFDVEDARTQERLRHYAELERIGVDPDLPGEER